MLRFCSGILGPWSCDRKPAATTGYTWINQLDDTHQVCKGFLSIRAAPVTLLIAPILALSDLDAIATNFTPCEFTVNTATMNGSQEARRSIESLHYVDCDISQKGATSADMKDMARMGRLQELRVCLNQIGGLAHLS